jgi:hypothetical protein
VFPVDFYWHHLMKMLIVRINAVVIDEDLSGFLEVDTTLIFCKIKALLPDSGNKALYVIDKPHES